MLTGNGQIKVYRGKVRWEKRQNFGWVTKMFPDKTWRKIGIVTKFLYFPHKCSIQCTNLRVDVNGSNVVQILGQGLFSSFLYN